MDWLTGERRARAQTAVVAVGIALGIGFIMQDGRVLGQLPGLPQSSLSLSAIATAQNSAAFTSGRITTVPLATSDMSLRQP